MKFDNYLQVREWLEQFIPFVYTKENLGLARIEYLLELLGNPERGFKSIHIAGTSGKGTTAFYCAKLLELSGFAVGLHTSPHLVDIRERMTIGGNLMPTERFISLMNELRVVVARIQKEKPELTPSYFEILVAASFLYFKKSNVDWAVVEVGLGGRLDATNVLLPEVSVITNISLDHVDILGKTIEAIAREKAGIIKKGFGRKGIPVVTGAGGKAFEVIAKTASERQSPLVKVNTQNVDIGLAGQPFLQGKLLAIEAVKLAVGRRFEVSDLADLRLAGRLEEVDFGIVLDGAHNVDKTKFLLGSYKYKDEKICLVVAFKKGKDWKKMIDLIMKNLDVLCVYATQYQTATDTGFGSGVDSDEISEYLVKKYKVEVAVRYSSHEAIGEAAQKFRHVLVCGSLYLVGEAETIWKLPKF